MVSHGIRERFGRLRRRGGRGPERDERKLRALVADALGRHATTTKRAGAATIAEAYVAGDDEWRRRFFRMLVDEFWTAPDAVAAELEACRAAPPGDRRAERRLRDALTPPAIGLLSSFSGLEGGVKLLVDLRADLLGLAAGDPDLAELDEELRRHLATLFDIGLLELRRITWDAPASLLEKLIEYEAVHAIDSWADLKNRLDSDRRCYAFFHPSMPDEPLVFVEIALTAGIATELESLLDESAPELNAGRADTAVFYSISNCQPGLAGVNLGNALIKQVVDRLRGELDHVRHYVTLSPIPGFRAWLEDELRTGDLPAREAELLPAQPGRVLARLADAGWDADEAIRPALLTLCARYLTTQRDGRVVDPVANFHLANGASVERLNWLADPSAAGRERSVGIMANYRYDPDRIMERAEAYVARGEVAMSDAVRQLLAG
ncbi:MAG: malonyl-CoA decarboxylase [Acidimicrobiia bacterium]|nr:MAG: malonyl-CoA decarboxylase [Acidimicrobiia bacterium]